MKDLKLNLSFKLGSLFEVLTIADIWQVKGVIWISANLR